MSSVGIRALKQNASQVVRDAAAGDVITITDRGVPVARLVPLRVSRLDEMRNAGLVVRATKSATDIPMPSARAAAGEPTLSETLHSMRDDERY